MLALQPSSKQNAIIPNLLPCKIAHSGPIPTSQRHWNPIPTTSSKPEHQNTQEVHFRGRKLRSKQIKLPEGYTGVIAQRTERQLPQQQQRQEDDENEELVQEVKVLETTGKFDEINVWAHEAVPEGEDVYVKGIEEWIGFAESVSLTAFHELWT